MKPTAIAREKARRQRERETHAELWARAHGSVPPHWPPFLERLDQWEAARAADPRLPTTRLVVAAPPGYAKSTAAQLVAARSLARGRSVILLSYSGGLARKHSGSAQRLFTTYLGGKIDRDLRSPGRWATTLGTELVASGLTGTATGFRAPVVIVDDHTAGRAEAESIAHREATLDAIKAVARTRVEPGGLVLIVATRWHPGDASGWALEAGYEPFEVRALDANDQSTWPERFATEELLAVRDELGDRDFASLYQSSPNANASRLFRDVTLVSSIDREQIRRISLGLDLAYSTRKSADWSVAVALAVMRDGSAVVIDVLRRQTAFAALVPELQAFQARHGKGAFVWLGAGQESVLADTLRRDGVGVHFEPARLDKISRAQRCATAWNAGRISVLARQPWTDAFVRVVTGFGPGARRDDDVDALVSAHTRVSGIPWRGLTQRPWQEDEERRRAYWSGRLGGSIEIGGRDWTAEDASKLV